MSRYFSCSKQVVVIFSLPLFFINAQKDTAFFQYDDYEAEYSNGFTGDPETDAKLQTSAIRKYFWSGLHWFYPVIGVGADHPINEKFLLGLDLRFWYPLSSAADWRFGLGFRITPCTEC